MRSRIIRWLTAIFSGIVEALGLFQAIKWIHKLLGYGEHIEFLTHLPGYLGRALIVIEAGLDKYPVLGLLLVALGLFLIWLRPRRPRSPEGSIPSEPPREPHWLTSMLAGWFRAVVRTAAVGWPLIVGSALLAIVYLVSDDDDFPTSSVAVKGPRSPITESPPPPPPPPPQARACDMVKEKAEELPWIYPAARPRYIGRCVKVSFVVTNTDPKEVLPNGKKYILVTPESRWGVYVLLDPAKWQPIVKKAERYSATCKIHSYPGPEEKRGTTTISPVYLWECEQD
jgi:hypothetical protein